MKHLTDSGILPVEETDRLTAEISKEKRSQDAKDLARDLVRQNKLTRFQAEALYHGISKGMVLGNYVLLDKIGAGGMGMVFKAEHRRMKRLVAVKVLPQAGKDPSLVKRFKREVEAAAKLTHANIVAAYDADEYNGKNFLVMEFVDGVDLAMHVKTNGPLPVDKALDYILQAARGLEHAHARGIVHRDIKPANLLLDKQGAVKILDMGLARIQEVAKPSRPIDEEAALTDMGNLMGTVDFMSPEQALDSRQADELSDLYSLGGTLHFLLTGRPMFGGDTMMARIMAHRESPIPSLRAARKDVPPEIDTIFQRLVAKNKEGRYPSATELIRDLTNWQTVNPKTNSSGGDNAVPQNVISAIFDD
ncbi:MAG TPA: serine/threonine-protein kinase [Planctomycetaceae bacterium]